MSRVLIVEDSFTQAQALKFVLEEFGYKTELAGNGKEGLEKLPTFKPEIVISDIVMPEMNGYDFCSALKASPDSAHIPVILLTALSDAKEPLFALQCGADSFVTKPYNNDFLKDRIEVLLKANGADGDTTNGNGFHIQYEGEDFKIDAKPKQITGLLLSTFANAMEKFKELQSTNGKLVTAQKTLEEKNTELEQLNEQKNQFLGIASHDLRNPLSTTLGYSEIILEKLKDDLEPDYVKMLENIHHNGKYMLNLVNEFLDFSRIEAGKLELHLSMENLGELVGRTMGMNQVIANNKDIKIEKGRFEEIDPFLVDPEKIDQVMHNLLSNAIKFSHEGTIVTVDMFRKGDKVTFGVIDQGQGIPEDEVKDLFQAYQKTSVKSTGGEKSTGLGLAIVKKIVEGHGGNISVDSKVGKGTTFTVEFPFRTDRRNGRDAADYKDKKPLTNLIFVDDDPDIRMLADKTIGRNYSVRIFENGEEFLSARLDPIPDLVLLDSNMPGLNGEEVLIEMLKSKVLKDIPVVFVTGATSDEEIANFKKLGALDVVKKPFSVAGIKKRLETIWESHSDSL